MAPSWRLTQVECQARSEGQGGARPNGGTRFARPTLLASGLVPAQASADRFEALGELDLEPARHGPVILALDTQIILRGDGVGSVVRVLITLAAVQPRRPRIVL